MSVQNVTLSQEIKEFEDDSKWFYEHVSDLIKQKFVGKFVAIKNKSVIASDKDINVVIKIVESDGQNPSYVVIEYVHPEGTVVLL